MGFDFDSRGEGKGKRDEKEQRGDQIGSCVSFRAAGSHRNLSVGYVALQAAYLVCQPISLSGPSNSRPRTTSQRPRALREFGDRPPLILPLTETAHLSIAIRPSGNLAISTAARSHDRFRLLGCNRFPLRLSTVRSPIRPEYHLLAIIGDTITIDFFANIVRTRCPHPLPTRARAFLSFPLFARGRVCAAPSYHN
jgi:hypothetical protein